MDKITGHRNSSLCPRRRGRKNKMSGQSSLCYSLALLLGFAYAIMNGFSMQRTNYSLSMVFLREVYNSTFSDCPFCSVSNIRGIVGVGAEKMGNSTLPLNGTLIEEGVLTTQTTTAATNSSTNATCADCNLEWKQPETILESVMQWPGLNQTVAEFFGYQPYPVTGSTIVNNNGTTADQDSDNMSEERLNSDLKEKLCVVPPTYNGLMWDLDEIVKYTATPLEQAWSSRNSKNVTEKQYNKTEETGSDLQQVAASLLQRSAHNVSAPRLRLRMVASDLTKKMVKLNTSLNECTMPDGTKFRYTEENNMVHLTRSVDSAEALKKAKSGETVGSTDMWNVTVRLFDEPALAKDGFFRELSLKNVSSGFQVELKKEEFGVLTLNSPQYGYLMEL